MAAQLSFESWAAIGEKACGSTMEAKIISLFKILGPEAGRHYTKAVSALHDKVFTKW